MGIKDFFYKSFIPIIGIATSQSTKIPVIYYHDVVIDKGRTFMRTNINVFLEQMDWLNKNGYQTLLFNEIEGEFNKKRNEKKVLIAFDDGWLSNYTIVFPEMKKRNMKFNIFISNKYINEGDKFLNWDQLRNLMSSGIVGIGAHTYNHIDSRLIDNDEIYRREIVEANLEIKAKLGFVPNDFCFPYGYYNKQIAKRLTTEKTYKRIYTSNYIDMVNINNCIITGRIGISTDDTIYMFKHKVQGHYRIIKYYSRMIGAGLLELHT